MYAANQNKQAQEDGGNSTSTSGDSKRSTDNNPLFQNRMKKIQKLQNHVKTTHLVSDASVVWLDPKERK